MILLDTNIISFLFKDDTRINWYKPHLDGQSWAISLMSVAELYQWATIYQWGEKRLNRMEIWIKQEFTVLPFDIKTSQLWAKIAVERRNIGQPISVQDAWIAATALQHHLTLVTHNPKDFRSIANLKIITERSHTPK